jgi:predicted LPLAT superfamily acyltransferase
MAKLLALLAYMILWISIICALKTPLTAVPRSRQHSARRASPVYLERMVERKKAEVDSLLRRHQSPDDSLVMRMSYLSSECRFALIPLSC